MKGNMEGINVTKNICKCHDGKYRWFYEFNMLKNPAIFITVLKVMGLSAGIVAAFVFLLSLPDSLRYGFHIDPSELKVLGILVIVFSGLICIAYLLIAALYGWKYIVLFEMDEEKVVHIQQPKQFKKAEAIGWITALAGALGGRPSVTGAGLMSAAKNTSTSEFKRVRKVAAKKRRETIYVNYLLDHNQVYAEPEDFDFVKNFISERCVNAKVK